MPQTTIAAHAARNTSADPTISEVRRANLRNRSCMELRRVHTTYHMRDRGDAPAGHCETLFVIHPDSRQSLPALLAFVARLNVRMAESELSPLQAFEAHPESNFRVGNIRTRRSPYPSFQVLSRALLKKASDSLLDSTYYSQFSPEMLRAVGMPRA